MPDLAVPRGVLLNLAIEGVIPVIGGCAGALAAGPAGGLAGVAIGQVVEKAINCFGQGIVKKWVEWFRGQPPAARQAALAELAELPADQARRKAAAALKQMAPNADPADRNRAVEYLAAIPRSVEGSLVSVPSAGGLTLPPTLSAENPQDLLQLLPADVPPYQAPSTLPGTEYRLEELIGTGGFGTVYRASSPSLQYLPLAIKFCLDPAMRATLLLERDNLERLMKAGGESWSKRIVRLYGYNLEHRTPFLVYEYVAGGDLVHWLAGHQARKGRRLMPAEVLKLVFQVAEALAFAHQHGLVHRDLKPANVLVADKTVKLADFGIGGVVSRRAAQGSRIGTVAPRQLSLAEQVSLYRGAGTPLYMSQEQRRGEAADPRHDLYSLGVMWFQLLVGDVTRELHPGWARELEAQFAVPRQQIELIQRCVGWIKERPQDAGVLLREMRPLLTNPAEAGFPESMGASPSRPAAPAPGTAARPPDLPKTGKNVLEDAAKRATHDPTPPSSSPLSTQESERSRHIRFVLRMRQLLLCHRTIIRIQGVFWHYILIGVGIAFWGGFGLGSAVIISLGPKHIEDPSNNYRFDHEKQMYVQSGYNNEIKRALSSKEYEILVRNYEDYPRKWGTIHVIAWTVAVLGGLAIFSTTIWLRLRFQRKAKPRAEHDLETKIATLLVDFPQECQVWGGLSSLREPEVVKEWLRELEATR